MPQMNPMFLLTSMMAFAFSLDDEDDEDYKPRVITKSVERKIAGGKVQVGSGEVMDVTPHFPQ